MSNNKIEISWKDLNLTNQEQNSVPYMSLSEGTHIIRIVSNPSEVRVHWEGTTDGKQRKIPCKGAGCPICAVPGHYARKTYQLKVIDMTDHKAKILECPKTVMQSIQMFATDDEHGDPTKYNIRIVRTGKGMTDTRYNVVPSNNKTELTSEELEEVAKLPSMEEINKAPSDEDIKAMNLAVFVENSISLDDKSSENKSADDEWDIS